MVGSMQDPESRSKKFEIVAAKQKRGRLALSRAHRVATCVDLGVVKKTA